MPDVFISYARSTAKQAQQVAGVLRGLGYEVWMDDQIPAHRVFSEVLEERLRAAKAVLVIWSPDATRSDYVRSEASRARAAGKLVQVTVEKTPLPMPFDQFECANLVGWRGEAASPGWRKVLAAVGELVGVAQAPIRVPPADAAAAAAEPLLAVLAFDNLSGDPEMAYFSDGVSEEILQTVARGADIKVIGRASSFQFRGAGKAAANVAAQLNATHVLDGSVRRSGSKVRIAANLIECERQTTLWSDRFDRELSDVFALQDEIAAAVAGALKATFAPTANIIPIDPAVYDAFLRAKDFSAGMSPTERSRRLAEVVAVAPLFAPGWANKAYWLSAEARFGVGERTYEDLRSEAIVAARTALQLDSRLGAAHVALSRLEPFAAFRARRQHLESALTDTPNDPLCLEEMCQFLSEIGRVRDALLYASKAFDLDPLFPRVASKRCYLLSYAGGEYEEVQALYDGFRLRWPEFVDFTVFPVNLAAVAGDWVRFERLAKLAEDKGFYSTPVMRLSAAFNQALRDRNPAFIGLVREALRQQAPVQLTTLCAAGALGLKEEAFAAIDGASFEHLFRQGPITSLTTGGSTPAIVFDAKGNSALINDARFVGLCGKLGLCHYWIETEQWPDCAATVPYDFKAECRRLAGAAA